MAPFRSGPADASLGLFRAGLVVPNEALFAYGTLRDPDVLARVLGHPAPAAAAPAVAPDCQVVFFPCRTYQALRQSPGAGAPGTLIEGLSDVDLLALDAFEGDEYRRGRWRMVGRRRGSCSRLRINLLHPTLHILLNRKRQADR